MKIVETITIDDDVKVIINTYGDTLDEVQNNGDFVIRYSFGGSRVYDWKGMPAGLKFYPRQEFKRHLGLA